MAVPMEFVIARHGQSERNAVEGFDWGETCTIETDRYAAARRRPDWQHRLSRRGEAQASQARAVIEQKLGGVASFDALYVSPYVRTFETAAHMGGPDASGWVVDENISERYWGHHNHLTEDDRTRMYPATAAARFDNAWYQHPEGGEGMMGAKHRFEAFWSKLADQHADQRVFAVSHHDTIYVAHRVIEDMLPEEWDAMYHGNDVFIGNCMLVNWRSVNPTDPTDQRATMHWKRYINPLDPANAPYDGEWIELPERRRYLGRELLKRVTSFDRLLDS